MTDQRTMMRTAIPVFTAVLLVLMLILGGFGPFQKRPEVQAYFDRVSAMIDAIPHHSGAWVGVDIPATTAAVELLQPNKLMQRRYTNTDTGEWFELLIVHCGDVRDMIGHYPPVCYPAHGWTLEKKDYVGVQIEGIALNAAVYDFTRDRELTTDSIVVTDVFALPASDDDSFGPDLALIERAGRFRNRARLGSAQIQVIRDPKMSPEHAREALDTAFTLTESVFREIERGVE